MHGSLELPASIELLEYCDGFLPVHCGCHPVTVLRMGSQGLGVVKEEGKRKMNCGV